MACKKVCKLCPHLVISQGITFNTVGNLLINIPAGSYENGEKYCIVIAQNIPAATTITAPVYITIGSGTTAYPLTSCDCRQLTACALRRWYAATRYLFAFRAKVMLCCFS